MRGIRKEENGLVIVEATILIPFCMLMVFALYYAALFMCQKANLQANLQNALVYYKNTGSDTYVEALADMAYRETDQTVSAAGSRYGTPEYLFPYRFLFGVGSRSSAFNEGDFASFFRSMCGHMFFDDGSNVTIEAHETNYVVYKTITATATQTVRPAIRLELFGLGESFTISVTGTAVVSDADELIRNTDFVVDIVEHTAFGEQAKALIDKAAGFYDRFKETFHIG